MPTGQLLCIIWALQEQNFAKIVPLLGSCSIPLLPLPLALSSHKQRRMFSLFPTCALPHWIRQQKFTSQQSRILSASTQKEIWYAALGSLNNLTFNNVFLCELVQHFNHNKLCGYLLPVLLKVMSTTEL